jgi:D-threo-aldose 1-dehydrogenase
MPTSPARRRRCTSRATSSGCASIWGRPTRCLSSAAADRFGLGCAPLGGLYDEVSDDDARATLDRAWESGVRFFDTAPLYGSGLSERRVGAALAGRPRDEYVLSTKVGRLLVAGEPSPLFRGAPPTAAVFDFSAEGVRRSLTESLERLGLDRVDLALIHDPDDHLEQALAEAYPALAALRAEGVVRRIGVGMNQWQALARFVRETEVDCVLVAGRYTLLDRGAGDELLPLCATRGCTVFAAGVFNSGLLAGGTTFDYAPASNELVARARELAATCARWGVPLKAAALQFPLRHPAVESVLVGCRTAAEVDEDLALLRVPIPAALWDELG